MEAGLEGPSSRTNLERWRTRERIIWEPTTGRENDVDEEEEQRVWKEQGEKTNNRVWEEQDRTNARTWEEQDHTNSRTWEEQDHTRLWNEDESSRRTWLKEDITRTSIQRRVQIVHGYFASEEGECCAASGLGYCKHCYSGVTCCRDLTEEEEEQEEDGEKKGEVVGVRKERRNGVEEEKEEVSGMRKEGRGGEGEGEEKKDEEKEELMDSQGVPYIQLEEEEGSEEGRSYGDEENEEELDEDEEEEVINIYLKGDGVKEGLVEEYVFYVDADDDEDEDEEQREYDEEERYIDERQREYDEEERYIEERQRKYDEEQREYDEEESYIDETQIEYDEEERYISEEDERLYHDEIRYEEEGEYMLGQDEYCVDDNYEWEEGEEEEEEDEEESRLRRRARDRYFPRYEEPLEVILEILGEEGDEDEAQNEEENGEEAQDDKSGGEEDLITSSSNNEDFSPDSLEEDYFKKNKQKSVTSPDSLSEQHDIETNLQTSQMDNNDTISVKTTRITEQSTEIIEKTTYVIEKTTDLTIKTMPLLSTTSEGSFASGNLIERSTETQNSLSDIRNLMDEPIQNVTDVPLFQNHEGPQHIPQIPSVLGENPSILDGPSVLHPHPCAVGGPKVRPEIPPRPVLQERPEIPPRPILQRSPDKQSRPSTHIHPATPSFPPPHTYPATPPIPPPPTYPAIPPIPPPHTYPAIPPRTTSHTHPDIPLSPAPQKHPEIPNGRPILHVLETPPVLTTTQGPPAVPPRPTVEHRPEISCPRPINSKEAEGTDREKLRTLTSEIEAYLRETTMLLESATTYTGRTSRSFGSSKSCEPVEGQERAMALQRRSLDKAKVGEDKKGYGNGHRKPVLQKTKSLDIMNLNTSCVTKSATGLTKQMSLDGPDSRVLGEDDQRSIGDFPNSALQALNCPDLKVSAQGTDGSLSTAVQEIFEASRSSNVDTKRSTQTIAGTADDFSTVDFPDRSPPSIGQSSTISDLHLSPPPPVAFADGYDKYCSMVQESEYLSALENSTNGFDVLDQTENETEKNMKEKRSKILYKPKSDGSEDKDECTTAERTRRTWLVAFEELENNFELDFEHKTLLHDATETPQTPKTIAKALIKSQGHQRALQDAQETSNTQTINAKTPSDASTLHAKEGSTSTDTVETPSIADVDAELTPNKPSEVAKTPPDAATSQDKQQRRLSRCESPPPTLSCLENLEKLCRRLSLEREKYSEEMCGIERPSPLGMEDNSSSQEDSQKTNICAKKESNIVGQLLEMTYDNEEQQTKIANSTKFSEKSEEAFSIAKYTSYTIQDTSDFKENVAPVPFRENETQARKKRETNEKHNLDSLEKRWDEIFDSVENVPPTPPNRTTSLNITQTITKKNTYVGRNVMAKQPQDRTDMEHEHDIQMKLTDILDGIDSMYENYLEKQNIHRRQKPDFGSQESLSKREPLPRPLSEPSRATFERATEAKREQDAFRDIIDISEDLKNLCIFHVNKPGYSNSSGSSSSTSASSTNTSSANSSSWSGPSDIPDLSPDSYDSDATSPTSGSNVGRFQPYARPAQHLLSDALMPPAPEPFSDAPQSLNVSPAVPSSAHKIPSSIPNVIHTSSTAPTSATPAGSRDEVDPSNTKEGNQGQGIPRKPTNGERTENETRTREGERVTKKEDPPSRKGVDVGSFLGHVKGENQRWYEVTLRFLQEISKDVLNRTQVDDVTPMPTNQRPSTENKVSL